MDERENNSVTIRHGTASVTLTPSTENDFAYINAHLRPMDKWEQDIALKSDPNAKRDSLDMMEKSWTLTIGGDIVGFVALMVPTLQSPLSPVRYMPMLSTEHVQKHWIDYVRLSRETMRYVIHQAPTWVTDFISAPFEKYEQSLRWHEKTMGWKRKKTIDANGEKIVIFHTNRKDW